MKFIVHTDGGARGNPGPAAVGIVIQRIQKEGTTHESQVVEISKRIGEATNNEAEYRAVQQALQTIARHLSAATGQDRKNVAVHVYGDSMLVVQQLNGRYKVKDPRLREFLTHIRVLEQEIGGAVHYVLIPRERNRRADFLVNQALDD